MFLKSRTPMSTGDPLKITLKVNAKMLKQAKV